MSMDNATENMYWVGGKYLSPGEIGCKLLEKIEALEDRIADLEDRLTWAAIEGTEAGDEPG